MRFPTAPLLALLSLLATGCGPGLPWGDHGVLRYEDFVTDAADLSAPDPRRQETCADQTHWVRPWKPGEELVFPLDLGGEPRLVLNFCRRGGGAGEVVARVSAGGREIVERWPVAGPVRWQRHEVDLSMLAGEAVEVRLDARLPESAEVLLRAAYVRHRTESAAGWPRSGVQVEWDEMEAGRKAAGADGRGAAAADRPQGAVGATAGAAGQGGGEPPRQRTEAGPRMLLVSVDTLRADAVRALVEGESRVVTPNLDGLVADAEVFLPHRAAGSWTKPSHASLLTGLPASVHGAVEPEEPIHPAVPTLAGRLAAAGLATGGLVHDCVWLNPKFGFHRGFDDYRSVKWGTGQLVRGAVNWIAAHRHQPFFFFLHTFDVHSDFARLPYEGEGVTRWTVKVRYGVGGYGCRLGHCSSGLLEAISRGEVEPLPREDEILRDLYSAGVTETDARLGLLLRDLRRMGLYDDMLIVVTADHGEMLLDHGNLTLHGKPWEPVLEVPLIVKWPRGERAGRVTQVPTSALDVAPTLLALAGADARDLPGDDLRRPRRERLIFSGAPGWWAVYRGDLKALFRADGSRRLYDLSRDPAEEHDLAAQHGDELDRLHDELRSMIDGSHRLRERYGAARQRARDSDLTADERRRLRALGYLGGEG